MTFDLLIIILFNTGVSYDCTSLGCIITLFILTSLCGIGCIKHYMVNTASSYGITLWRTATTDMRRKVSTHMYSFCIHLFGNIKFKWWKVLTITFDLIFARLETEDKWMLLFCLFTCALNFYFKTDFYSSQYHTREETMKNCINVKDFVVCGVCSFNCVVVYWMGMYNK